MLLDAAPIGGGIGLAAGVLFFAVLAAAAYIVFRLLKKTVKLAFRMAIVAVILLIAIVGSISFWWLGSSKPTRPERPRPTQPK
jgi:apolipoprotein N-acyltransferase